ncbi:hypothetical protein BHC47_05545 [Snodgrassella alvi]|uniref:Uncharacterized protein n=1 Tax=Snodgrassella alvi TaxID=1196083 RepID=A0A2N9Y3C1_9NEIS|nr:hypothetical protein [Snodgrassella alvi]PIT61958.1 hypothetical protein BHC47_05545 [Snodgrassella alvi]PIT66167.1 hypothetical protein BHC56_03425 [Snodgrassella alvi]
MVSDKIKTEYVKIINTMWSGTMQFNSIEYIDDKVIRLMDQVLTQIREGSKAMIGVNATFDIFYMKSYKSWAEVLKAAMDTYDKHAEDWIAVLRGYRQYKIVVDRVALSYKSPVQIALYEAADVM